MVDKYLRQIQDIQIEINVKKLEILQHKNDMYGITAMNISEKIIKSPTNDSLIKLVVKLDKLEKEYAELISKRDFIIGQIRAMENRLEMQVLYSFYVECKTKKQIADEIHYSMSQTKNFLRQGRENFYKKYYIAKN